MSVLKKVENYDHGFTKSQQKIAEFILNNPEEVTALTIQELAIRLGLSTASLSRFAKKVGCSSHKELKTGILTDLAILNCLDTDSEETLSWEESISDISQKLIFAINNTLTATLQINDFSIIEKAIDLIFDAQNLFFFASGSSVAATKELNLRLLRLSKRGIFLEDANFGAQSLVGASNKDLMISVSYSGETMKVLVNTQIAKENNLRILSITRLSSNSLSSMSDFTLYCPTVSNSDSRLSAVIRKYSQLFLTDLLYIGVAKRMSPDPEQLLYDYMDRYFMNKYFSFNYKRN